MPSSSCCTPEGFPDLNFSNAFAVHETGKVIKDQGAHDRLTPIKAIHWDCPAKPVIQSCM